MAMSDNARLIEAVLFLENEPLSVQKIISMTGLEEQFVLQALEEISEQYYIARHGLALVENSGVWSFVPCTDLYDSLRHCYGKKVDRRLTRNAIETLSIVAYSQPITRSEIQKIRGVDPDSILRILLERDYIRVVGRKDVPGHPRLFGTTKKFLYTFNLESISDLPRLSEIDRQRFEKEVEDTENEN